MLPSRDAYAQYVHDLKKSQRTPIVVPYYGGREKASRFILPLLPPLPNYVQPFGGAGTLLIKRPRMESREIYGDLSSSMVELLTMLRDDPKRTIWQMRGVPFARSIFEAAEAKMANGEARGLDAYIVHSQSWFSKADSDWGVAKHTKAVKAHANATREGIAKDGSGMLPMAETPLYQSAMRLQGVEIYCVDALDLIKKWKDDPDAMIHIDPPYLPEVRRSQDDYRHEMTPEQHAEMLAMVADSHAYIAISGYPSDLYDTVLSGWYRTEKALTIGSAVGVNGASEDGRAERRETLWMNYDIDKWRPLQGTLLRVQE